MADLTQFQQNNGGSGAFQFMNGGGFNSSGVAIAPPNTSTPVLSGQLNGGSLNLPPTTPVNDGSSLVAGIVGSGSAAIQPPTTSPTPSTDAALSGDYTQDPNYQAANNQYNQSVQDAQTAANGLPSQANLLQNAQTANGVPGFQNNVNELQTRLNAANAAFDKAYAHAEIGVGQTTGDVTGQQGAIRREQAVEAGVLATQLATAQGQYDHAEALAEKTATLQFSDAQNKIDNMFKFIQLNSDNLSRAEKTAADKIQAKATAAQTELDRQKEARTFALTNNITAPYYTMDGQTVIRSSDGHAFSTEAEAQSAGVNTTTWNNVQHLDASAKAVKFETKNLGTTKAPNWVHIGYSAAGNIVSNEALNGSGGSLSSTASPSGSKAAVKTTSSTKKTTTSSGDIISQSIDKLNANLGNDGFTDPGVFKSVRDRIPAKQLVAFDKANKSKLSPAERYKFYGGGTAPKTNSTSGSTIANPFK